MLFSFIAASCSDRIPDSGLIANDSDPRTRFAFTLGPRLAVAAPVCPSMVVFCRQKDWAGKEGKTVLTGGSSSSGSNEPSFETGRMYQAQAGTKRKTHKADVLY